MTLRDVCLAVQHDHCYASADNPLPNEKRTSLPEDPKRALEFRKNKSVNRDFNEETEIECQLSDLSDEESEITDLILTLTTQILLAMKFNDDFEMETEDPQEVKAENSNWLD